MLQSPARIYAAIVCRLTGHAHCKQVVRKTQQGPVIDCIIHYVNGCRSIENRPH